MLFVLSISLTLNKDIYTIRTLRQEKMGPEFDQRLSDVTAAEGKTEASGAAT